MKHTPALASLACLSFILLFSCTKDGSKLAEYQSQSKILPIKTTKPVKTPITDHSSTNARYPTDLALVELTNNGDGSWTGYMGGVALRFSDFMYEIDYDANEDPLSPQEGQPAWPQTVGPEPGVTTIQQFNCLTFISNPNSPDNQMVFQNHCIYQGVLYSGGAGLNSYFTAVNNNWSNYQTALANWNNPNHQDYHQGPVPKQPTAPFIGPYIAMDSYSTGSSTQLWTARFGVYSYNPTTGITFGLDAQ